VDEPRGRSRAGRANGAKAALGLGNPRSMCPNAPLKPLGASLAAPYDPRSMANANPHEHFAPQRTWLGQG